MGKEGARVGRVVVPVAESVVEVARWEMEAGGEAQREEVGVLAVWGR